VKTTAVAVVICAFVVSRAVCGEQSSRDFFVGGGWSVPLYTDNWALGYALGAGFLTSVAPFAKVGVSFDFGQFPVGQFRAIVPAAPQPTGPKPSMGPYTLSFYGGRADVFSIGPAAKILFVKDAHKVAPYFVVSARYVRVRTSKAVYFQGQFWGPFAGDSEPAFAMQFAIGIDLPLNQNAGLFLQAEFVNAFTGPPATQYLPFKAGIKFSP
jgi:hypothetical protein